MKKDSRKWLETYTLGIVAVGGIVISILDFLGLIGTVSFFPSIAQLSLLLLGSIALYIAVERRNTLEDIFSGIEDLKVSNEYSVSKIIESLQGVELVSFETPIELLRYTNERVKKAQKTIDDLSWTAELALGSELERNKDVSRKHAEITGKVSEKIAYREIFIFTSVGPDGDFALRSRYDKFERRITEDNSGYSCAFFEERPKTPLPQFMIIDNQEVIFLTDAYPAFFAVNHPVIVRFFQSYYNDIWNKAEIIKRGEFVYQDVVDKIREKFARNTL
jgi:hypothetical protein